MRATLTSKGQITLPAELRERLGLTKGDQVEFVLREGEVGGKAREGRRPSLRRVRGHFAA